MKSKYRFHLLGVAHTKTNKDYVADAYTQKVLKMGKMLADLGHEVIHYGAEGSDLPCTEHVNVVTNAEQEYSNDGKLDPASSKIFVIDTKSHVWKMFTKRAIEEINKRKKPRDILLCSMGWADKPIAEGTGLMAVEMGIGYSGTFSQYRVFESYAWMSYIYGMQMPSPSSCDGRNYDCVIPNYFDPDDFEFSDKKDGYLLYVGRLTPRKGVNIAYETAKKTGFMLKIAGIGKLQDVGIPENDPLVEYVGFAGMKERSDLMKSARAVMVPTIYLGPFEGVAVEAMFSGTPAITSDFGAFPETVQHGETGYRCRTLEQFVWAAKNAGKLDPKYIREYAVNNYSLERVGRMYEEYFFQLQGLFGKGWYEDNPRRKELDWLTRWR